LEMNSLSKAHNMAGWRVGMIAGDAEAISLILKVKSQMDSGMFKPLQLAAIKALSQGPEWFEKLNEEYRRRRAAACRIMDTIGAKYNPDSAGLFVFGKVEADNPNLTAGSQKTRGEQLSDKFLYEAGVFITPGYIFGHNGENYVRVSLCANPEVLDEANERIKKVL
ncbi:MAG: aminotransferase class I/II-fold pyridoxal phosphate-dependent enzyme, partial [Bacteroidales bacterium]|nr:aminotransferase class I/II-fold pyridoxal phosphate-dependent enzyme [Bacteroidales bacterium]